MRALITLLLLLFIGNSLTGQEKIGQNDTDSALLHTKYLPDIKYDLEESTFRHTLNSVSVLTISPTCVQLPDAPSTLELQPARRIADSRIARIFFIYRY